MAKTVKYKFFESAIPLHLRRTNNIQQARDFEARTGLTGIAGNYTFPRGLSDDDYQTYTSYSYEVFRLDTVYDPKKGLWEKQPPTPELAMLLRQLNEDWNELASLNPELKKVSVDKGNAYALHNALQGAVSRYNADDINFVLRDKSGKTGDDCYDPATKALKQKIAQTTGPDFGWVASPETLRNIEAQLKRGPAIKPPASKTPR